MRKDNSNPKRTEMLELSDKDVKAAMEIAAVTNMLKANESNRQPWQSNRRDTRITKWNLFIRTEK